MALLREEDGSSYRSVEEIGRRLHSLGIRLNHWPVGTTSPVPELLAKPTLSDPEKENVLGGLDHYFRELQLSAGYKSRDLIVIFPELPNLETMMAKFERCHRHDDDEVRYIVDGEGVFGFVRPDGSQVELLVEASEYINVPAGTEHWFHLTPKKRLKAVRYFTTIEGWVPRYTGTEIRIR